MGYSHPKTTKPPKSQLNNLFDYFKLESHFRQYFITLNKDDETEDGWNARERKSWAHERRGPRKLLISVLMNASFAMELPKWDTLWNINGNNIRNTCIKFI